MNNGAVEFQWAEAERRWSSHDRQAAYSAALVQTLVAAGDVEGVKALLASQPHCYAEDALFTACEHGRVDVVRCLITDFEVDPSCKCVAHITHTVPRGSSALRCAVVFGHLEVTKHLTVASNTAYRTQEMRQLAELASLHGHSLIAEWILESMRGWAPLHFACDARDVDGVVRMLRGGASPVTRTQDGLTPEQLCGSFADWSSPVCPNTLRTIKAACSGWEPRWHFIFPDDFRAGVVVVLMTARALSVRENTPHLSSELWHRVIAHLPWGWSWNWDWDWARHLGEEQFEIAWCSSESD